MNSMRFYVEDRRDYQNGKDFGPPGPYEFIAAKAATDAGEGRIQVTKPRDPAKGSGTYILDVNAEGWPRDQRLLEGGFTMMRLDWPGGKANQAGIREVLAYLRVTGGPMLLGDQPRFLKRLIAIDNGSWLPEFLAAGNTDVKGRPFINGALTTTAHGKPLPGIKVLAAEGKAADQLIALAESLKTAP